MTSASKSHWRNYRPEGLLPVIDVKNFQLKIPRLIYEQCRYWVNKGNFNECSWFGKCTYDMETGSFIPQKVVMAEQENSAGYTEMAPEALGKLMFELRDVPGEYWWWCHSHVNMACFWSQTDRETISDLAKNGLVLATVFNQKDEMRTALAGRVDFLGEPWEVFLDNVKNVIRCSISEDLTKSWDEEFEAKVKKRSYVTTYSGPRYCGPTSPVGDFGPHDSDCAGYWEKQAELYNVGYYDYLEDEEIEEQQKFVNIKPGPVPEYAKTVKTAEPKHPDGAKHDYAGDPDYVWEDGHNTSQGYQIGRWIRKDLISTHSPAYWRLSAQERADVRKDEKAVEDLITKYNGGDV